MSSRSTGTRMLGPVGALAARGAGRGSASSRARNSGRTKAGSSAEVGSARSRASDATSSGTSAAGRAARSAARIAQVADRPLQRLRGLVGDRGPGLEHPLDGRGSREDRLGHHRRDGKPVLAHRAEEILDLVGGVAEGHAADRVRRALERVRGPEDGRERVLVARATLDREQGRGHGLQMLGGLGQEVLEDLATLGEEPPQIGDQGRDRGRSRRDHRRTRFRPGRGGRGGEERRITGSELPDAGRVLDPDRADAVEDLLQEADEAFQEDGRPGPLLGRRGGGPLEQPLGAGGQVRDAGEPVERGRALQAMREHDERREGPLGRGLRAGEPAEPFLDGPDGIPGLHQEDAQQQLALAPIGHVVSSPA